ncbi:uncharacterized protein LOC114528446 [Dendronephthya gigantea]|uniref:uncharacterized protein LOC114528446 n=1 Tax=Dendronephthya gigantea TaxID=151771 RepID=UPI00106B8773|nr:uncharacterized protein LOC114528446 [Dendronephthya gigantea]
MAQIRMNALLLFAAVAFVMKTNALGGLKFKMQNLEDKEQVSPSYNEELDQLASLLRKETLKAYCESEKANTVWCQYKQLLELNSVYEQQRQKSVKKKSAGSMCWPGLPWPCDKKRLVPAARSVRAAENDVNDDNEVVTANPDDPTGNDDDEEKRAMKCRPGMVNCRGKKKGKRTLSPPAVMNTQVKGDCPQGWLFCL